MCIRDRSKAVSAVRNIFGYLIAVATAVLIYIVVSRFVVINANIPTRSMAPLIESEDRLMGFRMAYLFTEPKRGDVIIFRHKCYDDEEEQLLIKRIIGLPGDTIQITDNIVYIRLKKLLRLIMTSFPKYLRKLLARTIFRSKPRNSKMQKFLL